MSLPRFGSSENNNKFNHSVRDQILGSRVTPAVQSQSAILKRTPIFDRLGSSSKIIINDYITCPSHANYFITNMCLA